LLICFIIMAGFRGHYSNNISKVRLLLLQDIGESPMGISKLEFWKSIKNFDTIDFVSQTFIRKIDDHFKALLKQKTNSDISYASAWLIKRPNNHVDTFYSDQFFRYWKMQGSIYKDTSGFFKNKFLNLFNDVSY